MSKGLDGIIDISSKPKVKRSAIATGLIKLNKESIDLIEFGRTSKGDVREASTVAAIQAVKDTPRMIPHCHTIPIEGCNVKWNIEESHLRCTVSVISHWNTGVEMEALCGVTAGLLCAWDMLKSNEKNIDGQYPDTQIVNIKILEKNKQQPHN
ncbi:MAG: cyclic pyranopterin monophosphate synthase MoaC [Candidatus Thalassarchaeaceae archaeon]|nr:cyclic pyranopterin monophosphate synthase MoaC [Candidatus Thalassarchaeaceae archaeon]